MMLSRILDPLPCEVRLIPLALAVMVEVLVACGCATHRPPPDSKEEVTGKAELTASLIALSTNVSPAEARLLADTAYDYSLDLAGEYRAVRPAIFHNVLVNTGFKERGLCFQWADDLQAKLESLDLKTLQLHRACARLGQPREHSGVVVTAVDQPFYEGIILDAWRHSGRLYWGNVAKDKYPWIRVEIVEIPEVRSPTNHVSSER